MINIKGSYVGNRKDTTEALEFFRRGVIDAPFKTMELKDLQSVYDMLSKYMEHLLNRKNLQTSPESYTDAFLSLDKGQITGRIVLKIPE